MSGEPDIAAGQAVDELNRQVAALALENARLSGELDQRTDDLRQSREYQTAIGEVLTAISRSTVDLAPVLQTLTDTALRLCEAEMGFICRRDGEAFVVMTAAGATPEIAGDALDYQRYQAVRPFPIDRGSLAGRVALAGQPVQIPDIAADPEYRLAGATALGKIRTQVGVPLVREGALVGVLILSRQRVEPFSERQVGLLSTFADQAVIAMENARLLGELSESLDQQTATSEILQVINASPSNLAPVFEAMLDRAVRLSCSAYGIMNVWEGGQYRAVALRGVPQGLLERWVSAPTPGPRNALMRIVGGEDIVHIEDLSAYESYRLGDERTRALVETGGARSLLAVALRKEGALLGTLTAYRQEVRPFSDKQIALLQGFAAQAVIAMENARLINETREALERQTAATEILEVINSSPGSLTPVFDTILAKATDLCEAEFGILWLYRDGFIRAAAHFNVPPAYAEFLGRSAHPVNPINAHGRLLQGESIVHIADIMADEAYVAGDPLRRALVELGGGRAQITVPLRKEGAFLGDFVIYRKQAGPFSDKQILLLQSFAAQAVIAMENARLLGELRESLDQQTATSDVLKTISRSSTDLGEVLDTLLATVARLCRADQAYMFRRHGELHHLAAAHGVPAEGEAFIRAHPFRPERGTTSGRVALEKRVIHIHDVLTDPDYDYAEGQRNAGFRTMLGLPLLQEDNLLGVFVLSRTTVDPFAAREIELASGFADQAVIAIENARLFEELRDRQAELRVTLDNIGDGVVMFDADFRLASWNSNFQEMLDIPDAFVAGRPQFDDYLRLLAGRGELGDGAPESTVASYRERVTRQWSAERTRPDGRIIEVRNNPVPDGGAVLIYSDITERKRAETQIAAARDAAEESLEQQTATAEILQAISESPTNVQPVLDAVVKAAVRFCGAADALIILREGEGAVYAAHEGPIVVAVGSGLPLSRETAGGRAMVDGRTCHLPDIASLDPIEFAAAHRLSGAHGFRAALAAPLLRKDTAIGAVTLRKAEVGPFTPRQIELLETFAAQAVIAIENVRLFNDLRESLEQQTATADILSVISRSPTDVQPVLEAVTRAALRFCGAPDAIVILRDGDETVVAAHEGTLTATLGLRRSIAGTSFFGQAMLDGQTRQIADIETLEAAPYAEVLALARQHKWRSSAAAPMMHAGKAIGCVVLRKPEPGLLSPRQIALLETFAAQAVIAIENVRLFTELSESLEQQTATADVLKVIAGSPTDVQPVLDAVAKAAQRFCGAADAIISLREGEEFIRAAHVGSMPYVLGRNALDRSSVSGRAIVDSRTTHVPDIGGLDHEDFATTQTLAVGSGARAALAAPMLREGVAIGSILLRKTNAGPFAPKQIELLEAFAAQAVIAIENVRLFTELRESLDQQTSTGEILRVIASSPADTRPAFEAIAKNANRLLGGLSTAVFRREGDMSHLAAFTPVNPEADEALQAMSPVRIADLEAALLPTTEGRVVQIPDTAAETLSARFREVSAKRGNRSLLVVPLMAQGAPIGNVSLTRPTPGAFDPDDVQLLQTFADQAVIAIQNARLFTELSEALERQTATADILKVIASSPADTKPAFDTIAESANRLVGGLSTAVWRLEGDAYHLAAFTPTDPAADEAVKAASPLSKAEGDAIMPVGSGDIWEIADIENASTRFSSRLRDLARLRGYRAILFVPLMVRGTFIGFVSTTRREPGAFRPDDIQLLKTFADQAVIAIQNARLFNELNESLERQTATAGILKAIASSPTDVQPVLDAVAKAAVRFCGTTDAIVHLKDGNESVVAAHEGPLGGVVGRRRPIEGDAAFSAVLVDGQTNHYPDVQALQGPEFATWRQVAAEVGWRASTATPLLREGVPIGSIGLRRVEPGPFTPQQIELLKTFAAQAVIAIENVRLFSELRDSLEQQTATAEILTVISQSPTDVGPVLSAVARAAMKFCGANDALVALRDGAEWTIAAHEGPIETVVGERRRLTRHTAPGRAMADGEIVRIFDLQSDEGDEFPEGREIGARTGFRSALAAPLMRDEAPIGAISLRRREAGAFEPRQVELLKTFAAQAVIAIENVRLFTELKESLEQQTATAEVLRVISQSPTDVGPVLKAVAAAARRFCNAHTAGVILRDGAEIFAAANDGPLDQVFGQRFPLNRGTVMGRTIIDGHSVYVPDMRAADPGEYALGRSLSLDLGHRSTMAAPLLSEGSAIGCILLRKPEPDGFTARQRELAETFAAQAVIAIQNVRLFTELRDSLERLKAAQANLVQSEKMATLGQLTAGIAHEIKNPLNFVNNFAALSVELLDELKEAAAAGFATLAEDTRAEVDETMELLVSNLGKIAEHGKRADGIVRSMLSHSRGGAGDWAPSDINALVEEALNLAYHGARAQDSEFNVTLERDFAPTLRPIELVPQDLTRVFLNLFGNGFYAVGKRRKAGKQAEPGFRPTLKVTTRDLGEAVEVRVRDNGTGIPPDVREKLFQPFFTTKPTGEGTGLGLSISYDIVTQQHGGTIEVESEPGSFTEFTVRLPRGRRVQSSERA